jgi:ABC-2 type transport system ATP-binding protein
MGGVQPSVSVENLSKSYGSFQALKGISFSVAPGEIVGFVGPNGAGKTTTMKILTCFMAASDGRASVAGKDVHAEPDDVRQRIGYMPETVPLYEDMMVYDYLMFIASVRGVAASKRHDAVVRVSKLTGLKDRAGNLIRELSKGYRQRVGLAQAIIHEPEVVILDEPISGLDPNQIIEIRDLIKEIGEKKTVLFSTHILQEVAAVCDRIVVINEGEIVADGTMDQLQSRFGKDNPRLRVSFSKGASGIKEKLSALSSVGSVTPDSAVGQKEAFFLETQNFEEAVRQVLECVSSERLVLDSLAPERDDLETLFRRLTRGASEEKETT